MPIYESATDVAEFDAPWGKKVKLQQIEYEGGTALLQIRIQEGRRFTIMELDPVTAETFGAAMLEWARARGTGPGGEGR